ncbi:MAG: hypothetical protein A6F71_05815 [Cycloclasticus sp. symbiont of Poecilosclerida sp. M]|nr:MAG: hypothetical protein A6F71_05815 [Cycloclasticus sp. symbiont of Poecilosclerida sp. M]
MFVDAEAIAFSGFGAGSLPLLLDNLVCAGHESDLLQCQHGGMEIHNCNQTETAGVVCRGDGPWRP